MESGVLLRVFRCLRLPTCGKYCQESLEQSDRVMVPNGMIDTDTPCRLCSQKGFLLGERNGKRVKRRGKTSIWGQELW